MERRNAPARWKGREVGRQASCTVPQGPVIPGAALPAELVVRRVLPVARPRRVRHGRGDDFGLRVDHDSAGLGPAAAGWCVEEALLLPSTRVVQAGRGATAVVETRTHARTHAHQQVARLAGLRHTNAACFPRDAAHAARTPRATQARVQHQTPRSRSRSRARARAWAMAAMRCCSGLWAATLSRIIESKNSHPIWFPAWPTWTVTTLPELPAILVRAPARPRRICAHARVCVCVCVRG